MASSRRTHREVRAHAQVAEGLSRIDLATWAWTFGALLNLFLIFVFHQVFLANMADPVAMDNTAMFAGLAIYLAVSLASVVALLLRYARAG